MTFVTFERLRFASKSDKSVLFRRSLLQRKLHHNSSIQYQFQLFFNGWSVMISFLRITQSLGSKHDFQWYRSRKMYLFPRVFLSNLMFPFSVLQLLNKKGLLRETGPEKSFTFTKQCFVKNIKSNSSLPWGEAPPRIKHFFFKSSFPSSVDSRGVEDLHLTDPQDISKCSKQ